MWHFLRPYHRIFMWLSFSPQGEKKRLPPVGGNLCCSRSQAAKVALMLLGLGGCTTLSPLQEVKTKCLSQFLYRWSWVLPVLPLFGFVYVLCSQGLSEVPVTAFVTHETKTGPCPKISAELCRIFTVLISANPPCRYIAIILHQYKKKLLIQLKSLIK